MTTLPVQMYTPATFPSLHFASDVFAAKPAPASPDWTAAWHRAARQKITNAWKKSFFITFPSVGILQTKGYNAISISARLRSSGK
jgi:hypothetical protein